MIQSPYKGAAERRTGPGPVRVAAYCRVSTEKEEQLDSLARQKEFFAEYAERTGYALVRIYADEGVSGTSLRRREAFRTLISDARQGRFDMVVAKDISRFARNTVDFLQSIRLLKTLGINTVFLTANMESLGDSEFILTLFSALAQEESVNLSKRVKFGKKINAKKGRVPTLIFGYRRIDNFSLEIDPEEAAVVRQIYQMYLKGFGFRRISRQLNEEGRLTKLGCQWEPKGVRRILTDPIYCGHYVNNKYEIADVLERRQVLLPAEENYHHLRPDWAIIPEEEYLAAQAALAERSCRSGPSQDQAHYRHSSRYAFSGLIRCAECGYSFRRIHDPKKNHAMPYWLCSSYNHNTSASCDNAVRIREDQLLHALQAHIIRAVGDQSPLPQEIISAWEKRSGPASDREERLRAAELRRLQNKMKRYQELYSEDLLPISEFREKREKLQRRLERLSSPSAEKRERIVSEEDCRNELQRLLRLEDWDHAELHRIIRQIRVEDTGNVTVLLRSFDPGADPGPI